MVDYSDDEDYYSQGFERKGVVSVWFGLNDRSNEPDADTLQDLCGVGYYKVSDQEGNCFDFKFVDIEELLSDLSYSESFLDGVVKAAKNKKVETARWVTVQYDFAYAPERVKRKIEEDPIFIGVFPYSDTD